MGLSVTDILLKLAADPSYDMPFAVSTSAVVAVSCHTRLQQQQADATVRSLPGSSIALLCQPVQPNTSQDSDVVVELEEYRYVASSCSSHLTNNGTGINSNVISGTIGFVNSRSNSLSSSDSDTTNRGNMLGRIRVRSGFVGRRAVECANSCHSCRVLLSGFTSLPDPELLREGLEASFGTVVSLREERSMLALLAVCTM